MSEPLHVLIVGCGEIAGRTDLGRLDTAPPMTHAGAFGAHGRFAVTGCTDIDPGRAEAFSSAWSIPHHFNNIAAALVGAPATGWDVISVCTPDETHGDLLGEILESPPRLAFCEKPLDTDLERAQKLVAAYRDARIGLAVNHLRRWDPKVSALRKALAAGDYGPVHSIVGTYTKGLWHNGSHMLDLITNLFGNPIPEQVMGVNVDHAPNDPTIDVRLRLDDGTPVTLLGGDQRRYPMFELTIICADGTISMERGGFAWRLRAAGDSPEFPGHRHLGEGEITPGSIDAAMACAADNIAGYLDVGEPLACDGPTALGTLECCAAIAELARATG